MEAGGAFADMSSIAQRDRQDSANSLDLAARSALVFGAAGAGGGGAAAARFRTASSSAMRQQSDAAAAGLLQRQVMMPLVTAARTYPVESSKFLK